MSGWWIAAFVAQWILVLVLCVVVVALARQVGTLHLRLGPRGALEIDEEGPPLGEAIPARHALAADGGSVVIGGTGARRLVLFSSPTCIVCREVAPAVPVAAQAAGLEPVIVQDPDAERKFDVPGTPFALVLDELGLVRAKGTVNSLEQVEGLVDTAERRMRGEAERWAS
jgi:methylamine dehydrogenase accessory protein MauD